jgi:hypothetical protein
MGGKHFKVIFGIEARNVYSNASATRKSCSPRAVIIMMMVVVMMI